MKAKTGVSITFAALSALCFLAPTLTFADTSKDSKSTAKPQAPNSSTKPAKPATAPAKVQVIVEANAQTSKDDVNEAIQEVHGRIVNKTGDAGQTFYLIEVDRSTFNDTYKKLSKNKNFKQVSVNRGYSLQ
jgi:hypothetical protein